MASTEKELEMEGHTLWTADLLTEASRMLELARAQAPALRTEGIELKHITEMDQLREMVAKESTRVESKPPKEFKPTKEQERLLARAMQWRASLIRRADRSYVDDRLGRLRYRRSFIHHRLPDRVYEELFLLVQVARQDLKKLQFAGVDAAFIEKGEDLCYELQGLPIPNRKAQEEYEEKMRTHRYGPPPVAPDPVEPLPGVTDSAKALSILKGRLYFKLRDLSAAGQLAFNAPAKEAEKAEAIRKDFVLRIRNVEDDDDMLSFGKLKDDPPGAAVKVTTRSPAPARPAAKPPAPVEPVAAAPAEPAPPAPHKESVLPGGGPMPAPSDPLKKPPPRAVGLVRPSPTTGYKPPSSS